LSEAISVILEHAKDPVEFVRTQRDETVSDAQGNRYNAMFRLRNSGLTFPIFLTNDQNQHQHQDAADERYSFILKKEYYSGTAQVILMDRKRQFLQDLWVWMDLQWFRSLPQSSSN